MSKYVCDRCGKPIKSYELLCPECDKWLGDWTNKNKYRYIIMCGGQYKAWEQPRQLTEIGGEPIVARTIRLLRENEIENKNIAISSNLDGFENFGVKVLKHDNPYKTADYDGEIGYWVQGFYPMEEPVCYLFGDVVFSEDAIRTIVETETDDIEFFASAPPFDARYIKKWAEPFAFKVRNPYKFIQKKSQTIELEEYGFFKRRAIAWELWQVIKGTPLNIIDYTNYTVINDWTCDIDDPSDVEKMESFIK